MDIKFEVLNLNDVIKTLKSFSYDYHQYDQYMIHMYGVYIKLRLLYELLKD